MTKEERIDILSDYLMKALYDIFKNCENDKDYKEVLIDTIINLSEDYFHLGLTTV